MTPFFITQNQLPERCLIVHVSFFYFKHQPCPLLNISAISEQLAALCSWAVLPLSFTFSLSLILSLLLCPFLSHPAATPAPRCADVCVPESNCV